MIETDLVFVALGTTIATVLAIAVIPLLRSRGRISLEPLSQPPVVSTNIRVLRDEAEIREVAQRACEREHMIARAAERRAAHFGELTQQPDVPPPSLRLHAATER